MTYHEEQRFQALERRLDALEQERLGSVIRGWSAAARALNVSTSTVRRRFRTDPKFPKPVSMRTFKRKGDINIVPEWTLSQITSYR